MPHCEKFMDLISAELDGALTNPEKAELYAHLEYCENCCRYRDALLAVEDALASDMTPPPATLAKSVMARVNALPTPGAEIPKKKPKLTLLRALRSVTVAAMAVLVIWTGSSALTPKGSAKLAAPEAAPAAMDMAAAESSMAYSVRAMGEDTALADEAPMEMAPMITEAAPETEEFAAYAANGWENRLQIHKNGTTVLDTEDPTVLAYLQEVLVSAEPVTMEDREADFVLCVSVDGVESDTALWIEDGALYWQMDSDAQIHRSPVAAEEFLRQFSLT